MQIGSGASNHNNTNNTSIVILSTSRQDNGISLGMTGLLRIIGSSIAPALAAMFMQGYQYTVSKNIKPQILSWLGVISKPYHFGGVEFSLNKKDMGHIHGEKLADLPFPIEICKDLIDSRRALPHIIYPESM